MFTGDHVLRVCASVHPSLPAVTLGKQEASFGEIDGWADAYANAMVSWGVGRGTIVLVVAETSIELICLHFALARIGAVFVSANPAFSEAELLQISRYLGTSKIVVDGIHQPIVAAVCERIGADLGVLSRSSDPTAGTHLGAAAVAAHGQSFTGAGARPEDIQVMYLTSGSTGTPKAAMISNQASWLRAHLDQKFASSVGAACMFPLYHMAGWLMLYQAWSARRPIHFVPPSSVEHMLAIIERTRASSLYAIPAVWRRILSCRTAHSLTCLRAAMTGTSPVEQDLILALLDRFPQASIGVGYGSTEVGSGLWLAHEDLLRKPGSVGLPTAGVEARIDDGELLLRSDALMRGYYKLADDNAACLSDGWYRTGDLAERDEEGYFSIVGRRRDVIRSGGETIVPAEVERLLGSVDGVKEIAIVGLPDKDWGEIVCAAIVYAPGANPITVGELRRRLCNLATFKHPRRVIAVEWIPRTPATGQVQRGVLREAMLAVFANQSRRQRLRGGERLPPVTHCDAHHVQAVDD